MVIICKTTGIAIIYFTQLVKENKNFFYTIRFYYIASITIQSWNYSYMF